MPAEAVEDRPLKSLDRSIYPPVVAAGLLALGYFAGSYRPPLEPTPDKPSELTTDTQIQPDLIRIRDLQRPLNTIDPEGILASSRISTSLNVALNTYFQQGILASELQGLMRKDQSPEVVLLMEQAQRHHILSGVGVLQKAFILGKSQDFLYVDKEALGINDNEYNMADRFELQLAGSWLELRVDQLTAQLYKEGTLRSAPKEGLNDTYLHSTDVKIDNLSKDLASLVWLKKNHPPIEINPGSFNYFGGQDMAHISRVLQLTERFVPGLINSISWHPREAVQTGEKIVGGNANPTSRVINLENRSRGDSLTHEIGHLVHELIGFVDDFKLVREGDLGQIDLARRLEYVSGYAMTNHLEDFASTFDYYINYGEDFRTLLEQTKYINPAAYLRLQARYDFMHDKVLGEEYSASAKPRDLIKENTEQRLHGIALRQDGQIFISPDPQAWNEVTSLKKRLPIIALGLDDGVPEVNWTNINLEITSKGLYQLEIEYTTNSPILIFQPVAGYDRVSVRNLPERLMPAKFGLLPSNIIKLPELKEGETRKGALLRVENFSPIEVNQTRVVFDNDEKNPGVNMRANPGVFDINEPIIAKIFDDEVIDIIEGPVKAQYVYSGREELFWKIRVSQIAADDQFRSYTEDFEGWIPQRWIGREFASPRNRD